ncbi:MAG: Gfo/Idh/MocA family oxidoreductase [Candidatus Thermoplasmatota archaeon]|nr:Gfo/Idh/MocA family oxidoreductase [Candidatus Thermoplasmatota archaeon]
MRIGIVGLGYWGRKVFREYLALVNEGAVDAIHMYDAKIDLLSDQNFRNASVVVHDSYQSLIDSVDAVHICVPNDFHYEYTSKSLEAGVSTLVEKPLTKNSTEAFNLVETALENGVVLQVGNIFRFANSIRAARELILSGEIGAVHHAGISWTHMAPSENSRTEDVLWDLGPHIFDIVNFLTGLWPVSVIYSPYAGGSIGDKLAEADLIVNYMDFTANIRISLVDHRRTRLVEMAGTKGTIMLDPVNQNLEIHSNGSIKHIEVEKNNTLRDEIMNFIECSLNGRTKVNSGNLGTAIVRELEQIYGAGKNESFTRIQ